MSTPISTRLGEPILEAGFTPAPNLLLHHYAELGITPAETLFIIHILEFKWTKQQPYPALSLIAERMGMTRRNVRKYVQSLRDKGFLVVTERFDEHGQTSSLYDFEPLFKAVLALGTNDPREPEQMDRHPRNERSPEEDTPKKDSVEQDRSSSRRTPTEQEQRNEVAPWVEDFHREFRDEAPYDALLTTVAGLYAASGLSLQEFVACMYQARETVKARPKLQKRAAYWITCLKKLVKGEG